MDDTPGRALDEYLVSLSQAGSVEALDGLARRWTRRLLRYLFYREDLSVEEIASVLGIPVGTVKSRLHHAREALKRLLGAAARGRE